MTHQNELFFEDIYDALRGAVQAVGGAKIVANKLWPTVPLAQAHRDLLDALNRERPRKLDPYETFRLLRLAQEAGFHGAFHFGCDLAGYAKSMPVDPKDEALELQGRAERLLAELKHITERQERLLRSPISLVAGKGA